MVVGKAMALWWRGLAQRFTWLRSTNNIQERAYSIPSSLRNLHSSPRLSVQKEESRSDTKGVSCVCGLNSQAHLYFF